MKTMNITSSDVKEKPHGDTNGDTSRSTFREPNTDDRTSAVPVPQQPNGNTHSDQPINGTPAAAGTSVSTSPGGGETRTSRRQSTNEMRDRGNSKLREPLLED